MAPTGHDAAKTARTREPTLRGQLVSLLILFTVGPLVLTNAWGYLQSRRYFARSELRNVHDVAALEALGVFRFVRENHRLVASIVAGDQHLFGLLRALATPDPVARASVSSALASVLVAKAQENEAIDEFYILSPADRLLGSSQPRPTAADDPGARLCFRRGRQVPAIDGIDDSGARPALLLSAPIVDAAGTFLGVFCARVNFRLTESLTSVPRLRSSPTSLTLLGPGHRIVAESPDHPQELGHPLRDPAPGWRFAMEPWEGQFATTAGHDVIAAYAPIPELGWGVLVQTPVAAALASLDVLKWQATAFAVILSTLVLLAVVVISRRISEPLMALAEAARRSAAGALGVSVPPGGTVEIADLARSFNRMSTAVKESHELLEQRIRERTHELQTSQEFSERLLNSIAQPVLVVDRELKVVKANRAAVRRYGPQVVGGPYNGSFECRGGACVDCPTRSVFETRQPASADRLEHVGEAEDVVNLQMFPVLSHGGEVEAVIQLRRVVTDERRLQAQMVSQEKLSAFGIIAAGVAHEIGNPLAAIESQLRLAREAPAPGRVEQTLEVVGSEVRRIGRLLRELVTFTRRRDELPARVSVEQVINDVARLLRNDPRAKQVKVEIQSSAGGLPVAAKEDHLVQVFLNLGLNALDAMPKGGTLAFETARDERRVLVRVRDTGSGVADQARGHLFEPFFTTKAPGRGTGLGLFVSKGIVEGMNGSLELEATGASGSVFRIDLPIAAGWVARS